MSCVFVRAACLVCLLTGLSVLSVMAQPEISPGGTPGRPALPALNTMVIGLADLIAVGTVTDVRDGAATVRVDRLLHGINTPTFTVQLPMYPMTNAAGAAPGGIDVKPNQQQIFILQRAQGGYGLVNGIAGLRPVADLDKLLELLKAFPYEVAFTSPAQYLAFDKPVPVTITIKNNGATPVMAMAPMLEGFFFAPRLDPYFNFFVRSPNAEKTAPAPGKDAAGMWKPPLQQSIEPGAEFTFTLEATCRQPAGWKIFTPDTYLQSPVAFRARVYLQPKPKDPQAAPVPGYQVASPWTFCMAGFPLPAEFMAQPAAK